MRNQSTTKIWLQPHKALNGESLIDHLFKRFDGLYPSRFRAGFVNEASAQNWRETWADAFSDQGVTPDDIARGLRNCLHMFDWPPSLTQFLRACRPYLQPEIAFFQAVEGLQARAKGQEGSWAHPAIFYAALAVGQFDMLNQPYQTLQKRWEKAFESELSKRSWPEIPSVYKQIPEKIKTRKNIEQAKKAHQLFESVFSTQEKTIDSRQWAKNILSNPIGRTNTVVAMAQQALEQVESESLSHDLG